MQREGYKNKVYLDSSGYPTLGVGHLLTPAEKKKWPVGTKFTDEEVMNVFATDLGKYEVALNDAITVDVTQHEFDAMISLAFNIGIAGFKKSEVLRLVNQGAFDAASDAFMRYNHSAGKVVKGLTTRRKAESRQFDTFDESDPIFAAKPSLPEPDVDAVVDATGPSVPPNPAPSPLTGPKTVPEPASTGGTKAATGLPWKLPTIGGLLTVAWSFISQAIDKGYIEAKETAHDLLVFFSGNFWAIVALAIAALGYLALKKHQDNERAKLQFKNAENPDTPDVIFQPASQTITATVTTETT